MFDRITHSAVYVLDQDEALDFYVGRLGLEVATDADLGHMRWLTVRVPADPDREILLERPGPPFLDAATADRVRELLTKGALGLAFILHSPDVRATHAELRGRGVEFLQEPTKQSYGIDCALRDPFGNHIRIAQRPGGG